MEQWYATDSHNAADTAELYEPGFILDQQTKAHCKQEYDDLYYRDEGYNVSGCAVRDLHACL